MATKQTLRQKKYDKANTKQYLLKMNLKHDSDIIEKLSQVDSMQGYIKQLIREDIARTHLGSVPGSVPETMPVPVPVPVSAPKNSNEGNEKAMTKKYIIESAPKTIAEENSESAIREAIDSFIPSSFADDSIFGDMSPAEFADDIAQIKNCEQCLVEWYDEAGKDRPGTAEDLALAYQLLTALYLKVNEE